MGAMMTTQTAAGKTVSEAYERAVADATAEYGHQEGYSGAINSKARGYVHVTLPPRMTVAKLLDLLEDDGIDESIADLRESIGWRKGILDRGTCKRSERPAIRAAMKRDEQALKQRIRERDQHAKQIAASGMSDYEISRIAATFRDKWAEPLAVEVGSAERKRRYSHVSLRRGERLFVFLGYAPS